MDDETIKEFRYDDMGSEVFVRLLTDNADGICLCDPCSLLRLRERQRAEADQRAIAEAIERQKEDERKRIEGDIE